MKTIQQLVLRLSPVLLGISLAGCATHPEVKPLTGGYEEITHPIKSEDAPVTARVSLNYLKPDGQTVMVWPSLFATGEIMKGGTALFVGEKAYVSADADDPRGTKPRLFAVTAPDLPLDITDEVLWYWAKQTGKDFAKATRLFNIATLVDQGGKVEVQLEFYVNESGWPDNSSIQLDWNQISEIMRTVKAKGTVRKDPRWGTPYIQN